MMPALKRLAPPSGGVRRALQIPMANAGVLAGGIAVLIVIGQLMQPAYLSTSNLRSVSDFELGPLIVALGASAALLGGIVDLSIGAALGLGATVFAYVIANGGPFWLATAACLLTGVAVGAYNGILSVGFGVNPLVATLSTYVALPGVNLLLDNTSPIAAPVPGWQDALGVYMGPVSMAFLLVLAAYAIATSFIRRTRPGRHIRAAGGNLASAERAGIHTGRIRFALFLFSAICATFTGMVEVGQLTTAPTLLGSGLTLQVFAGILLGGFSVTQGGVGSLTAAILGITLLDMLGSLLDLSNISSNWQQVVIGCILVLAVFLDNLRRRERFL